MGDLKYVVVKDDCVKRFAVFHDTEQEAVEEAKRLAKKEGCRFFILALIGQVYVEDRPIKTELWGGYILCQRNGQG